MKPKIIVIGAGLAGLTAAYRLQQKNYDVEVYEAHSRVGGRVLSALIKNLDDEYSVAELGGQNITDGGEAKSFHALAQELNLEIHDTHIDFKSLYYDGKNFVDDAILLKKLNFKKDTLDSKLAVLEKTCSSMQEVLDQILHEQPILKSIFSCMLNGYEGSPPNLLSTYHNITTLRYMLLGGLSEAHEKTSTENQLHMQSLKKGNATLPLKLAEKLAERIYLNKILKKVSYTTDNKLLLQFQDKTQTTCDKLLLAIPAPIYDDINFADTIGPTQLSSIKQVQYGKNAKILIPIKYHQLKHESIITDNMVAFFNSDKKLLNLYFNNDDGTYYFKNTLFAAGLPILKQGYENISLNESDPAIAAEEQFKKYEVPVAKSWVSDPYIKGSYSNYSVILKDKLQKTVPYKNIIVKEIFAPVNDQIFFMGEHATIISEIGTMEAALESGERIAALFE